MPEAIAAQPAARDRRVPWAPGAAAGTAGALILLVLFNVVFTNDFVSSRTLNVNLTQVAPTLIVAIGMTLVIATGGIDLSVGSLMAISGSVAALILLSGSSLLASDIVAIPLAFVAPVLVAGAFGLFNGALVTRFKLQPIIATLVLFIAGRGIAQVITNGQLKAFKEPSFQYIGLGRPLGIPFQVIIAAVIVAAAWFTLRRTTFGRYILAVGGNERAAELGGVLVGRVKFAVYGISGLCAGIAGLIAIAINSSSDANRVGLNAELEAIAAVAVGGTALTGGQATIIGTVVGALIIQLLRFSLLSHGVPAAVALIVQAGIIIAAVALQRQRSDG
ncbi:MAG: galactofuranose transport system permease protein [Solirubrobacteraceae bacterium]|nr:galactofuranose transport system permease protein [Solirubrobacteraceae bacterium]